MQRGIATFTKVFLWRKGGVGEEGEGIKRSEVETESFITWNVFFYGEGVSIGFSVVETIEFFGTKVEQLRKKVELCIKKVEIFSGKVEDFI